MEGTLWYEFSCGLRGFHVYSNIWKPKLNKKINITHERGNMYDPNTMAGKMLPGTLVASIVGHIPKEIISRYTRYIVDHGASVDAFVLATHDRPSPLIQGGLEIPIKLVTYESQGQCCVFQSDTNPGGLFILYNMGANVLI